jgi:uncharacterized protein (DUF1800 family)
MIAARVRRGAMVLVAFLAAGQFAVRASELISSDDGAIAHALSRLTFGARPGDVERVRKTGLARWIDEQLDPRGLDDRALADRLSRYKTLALHSEEIAREYFIPARQARRARQREQGAAVDRDAKDTSRPAMMTPDIRQGRLPVRELAEAKLLRAVYSERQLEETLVDFWFNHFNVFAGKGRTQIYLTEYERDVIRPHVFGSFRELLGATARSPAMLFYLDNWINAVPGAESNDPAYANGPRVGTRPLRRGRRNDARRPERQNPGQNKRARGLNENYGRELLELHTLGVDGGYTQADVVEVARAFTGWTIDGQAGGFRFAPALHDRGEKRVLGHTIKAGGGIEDGERVLDILASHPSTARYIARRLAERFVSDTPPSALVDRAARRFRDTHGNLREVVREIVTSPEFFAADARAAKMKTPLEFVASALRASGADVRNPGPALRALQQLGMMPYMCQPPTGYHHDAEAWTSPGSLVARMNFATQLTSGKMPGIVLAAPAPDLAVRLGSPDFQRR